MEAPLAERQPSLESGRRSMEQVVRRLAHSTRTTYKQLLPSDFVQRLDAESAREARRVATAAGTHQLRYSGDAWLPTLKLWHARSLDRIQGPWCSVMAVTTCWTVPIMVSPDPARAIDPQLLTLPLVRRLHGATSTSTWSSFSLHLV